MSGYHGKVRVGGAPDVRELTHLIISKAAVGPMNNNTYLLRCRNSGEQLLIDAAAEPETLLQLIGLDSGSTLDTVVTTHRHGDHWQALAAVARETGARTAAGRIDASGIGVPTTLPLDDGDVLRFGEVELTVRRIIGHTPGSIVLVYDDPNGQPHLFSGDSLFPGGPGKTWSPEDFRSLMAELESKVFGALPDETWVYPGHGHDTTLGVERPHLPEWWSRGW
jgi:glyoxylase-like metal-dependent hydrolase (beta-lactamase superfamily II)